MHLHSFHIRNFRRLKDVHVDLEEDVSIFVGANNSGKTSATQAFNLFVVREDKFEFHDFSADCCRTLDKIGAGDGSSPTDPLPTISLDLWLKIEEQDLHRVIDLIPSLNWATSLVGLRIEFGPADEANLLSRYREAKKKAYDNAQLDAEGKLHHHPWPETLSDYLTRELGREFEFRYYVLDRARFDDQFQQEGGYEPAPIVSDKSRNGHQIVKSLLRIDFLNAQKHLTDVSPGGRAEDLSRRLGRFYERNRDKGIIDYEALRVLATAEKQLSGHLTKALASILERLETLGYPGLDNPKLLIKSAFNPASMLGGGGGARVHYVLDDASSEAVGLSLPDKYNGLGFKNLIYMVVELLDFQARWKKEEEDRPPLHLVFIEEPEAHLHTQLQQVFIRQVSEIMKADSAETGFYRSQIIVTTHSPHILHERGFRPIRYFKRMSKLATRQTSEVLNLSRFYELRQDQDADFLVRYMKLTHCDLFFADAAILVEGNVERLLMPLMIKKVQPTLGSKYLSILEIGGAFGHRFRSLIDFLGITTLIITDLDSVRPSPEEAGDTGEEEEEIETGTPRNGSACLTDLPGAVTSNQTLIQWLPRKRTIQELLEAGEDVKECESNGPGSTRVRVAYQVRCEVRWKKESSMLAGRTLEEAFALQNLEWCQANERQHLRLRIPGNQKHGLKELAEKLHGRVKGTHFKKTDFALALLGETEDPVWTVPGYIADGLLWLAGQLGVVEPSSSPASAEQGVAA